MVHSASRAGSFKIIAIQQVKHLLGINPMGLDDPRSYSLEIISYKTVKQIARDYPNGP